MPKTYHLTLRSPEGNRQVWVLKGVCEPADHWIEGWDVSQYLRLGYDPRKETSLRVDGSGNSAASELKALHHALYDLHQVREDFKEGDQIVVPATSVRRWHTYEVDAPTFRVPRTVFRVHSFHVSPVKDLPKAKVGRWVKHGSGDHAVYLAPSTKTMTYLRVSKVHGRWLLEDISTPKSVKANFPYGGYPSLSEAFQNAEWQGAPPAPTGWTAKAGGGRAKNPKGPHKNPTIREAQAAEQILGWDATCDIVGAGGLSGASGYNLSRLVARAKKEDRKTFDKLVRVSARHDRKANPVAFAPGTHVQIRKDHWTGLGIRDGIVEGHTGTFAGYNHRTYWRKADGSLHDIDTRALEPVRKSNPSWKPVGTRPLGDGAWSRGAWRIELADRPHLRKGVQYDLFHHDTFVKTFKTRAAAEKAAAAKRKP